MILIASKKFLSSGSVPQSINLDGCDIKLSNMVHNLGVSLHPTLSFQLQTSSFCHNMLSEASPDQCNMPLSLQKLLCVFFILSRLDYCNTLLVNCPKYLLSKLHKIQNNAARLIFQTPRSARALLCFTVFLLSRESSTNSGCCVLKSSLIRPLPVSQTFTFTLILVSSIVRQTP